MKKLGACLLLLGSLCLTMTMNDHDYILNIGTFISAVLIISGTIILWRNKNTLSNPHLEEPIFASTEKIEEIEPFVEEFLEKIIGTSYSTSFVSDESDLYDWEHYLSGGKNEIILKVKNLYHVDIGPIYNKKMCEVLLFILTNKA